MKMYCAECNVVILDHAADRDERLEALGRHCVKAGHLWYGVANIVWAKADNGDLYVGTEEQFEHVQ